jgi:hypothetical protein
VYFEIFSFWSSFANTCVFCPVTGWDVYQNGNDAACFSKLKSPPDDSFDVATNYCQSNGGSLVVVQNEAKLALVQQYYTKYFSTGDFIDLTLWVKEF